MRLVMGMLILALIGAWGAATPAAAQCDPSVCSGAAKAKAAKAKAHKKPAAVKKPKDMYMRSAP